jgi:hypothetical protein
MGGGTPGGRCGARHSQAVRMSKSDDSGVRNNPRWRCGVHGKNSGTSSLSQRRSRSSQTSSGLAAASKSLNHLVAQCNSHQLTIDTRDYVSRHGALAKRRFDSTEMRLTDVADSPSFAIRREIRRETLRPDKHGRDRPLTADDCSRLLNGMSTKITWT